MALIWWKILLRDYNRIYDKYLSLLSFTASSSSSFSLLRSLFFSLFSFYWGLTFFIFFLLLSVLSRFSLRFLSFVVSSWLSFTFGISAGGFWRFNVKILCNCSGECLSESTLDHFSSFSINSDLYKTICTLSILIYDSLGTQSNLL